MDIRPAFCAEQAGVRSGLIIFVLVFMSCGGVSEEKAVNVLGEDLRKVSSVTVFFGHQSVGYNILDGIQDIYDASGIRIRELPITPDRIREGLKSAKELSFVHQKGKCAV